MSPAGLPLELQVGLLNPGQRKVLNGSRRGFEGDYAIFESGESAIPIAPAFLRIAQADSRLLALKPLIILGFEELAFHPGGTHFERISPARDDIFDIQDGAHVLRNQLAVAMRHALGFIDRNADKAVLSAALDFDLDQLHTLGLGHAARDFLDFGSHFFLHVTNREDQQKSGLSPTLLVRHSSRIVPCLGEPGKSGRMERGFPHSLWILPGRNNKIKYFSQRRRDRGEEKSCSTLKRLVVSARRCRLELPVQHSGIYNESSLAAIAGKQFLALRVLCASARNVLLLHRSPLHIRLVVFPRHRPLELPRS